MLGGISVTLMAVVVLTAVVPAYTRGSTLSLYVAAASGGMSGDEPLLRMR